VRRVRRVLSVALPNTCSAKPWLTKVVKLNYLQYLFRGHVIEQPSSGSNSHVNTRTVQDISAKVDRDSFAEIIAATKILFPSSCLISYYILS
jgi:hypothetical protein